MLLLCWLAGGLVALVAGYYGMSQIKAGQRSETELWMARTALGLSWTMTVMPLGVALKGLLLGFSW
jgi:hypothetical protein